MAEKGDGKERNGETEAKQSTSTSTAAAADAAANEDGSPALSTSTSASIPKLNAKYGSQEYWEHRFAQEPEYEWLLSYQQLAPQLEPLLQKGSRILIVGCGNSPFSADLYDAGYHQVVNIDYSANVISNMVLAHAQDRPTMEWHVMDMTNLSTFDDALFDVVIDKAAMDALMTKEGDVWNPDATVVAAAWSMCRHVSRVLKPQTGIFFQVSLAQPHFRTKYLLGRHGKEEEVEEELGGGRNDDDDDRFSTEFGWSLHYEAAGSDDDKNQSCFGHFLYIMQKTDRS